MADDWAGKTRVDESLYLPPPRVYLGGETWQVVIGTDEKITKKRPNI